MERVILARHGESDRSVGGLTNGDPLVRVALTATGREEARRLGRELADDPIDFCVTSEFERARETADLALEGREVPRLVLADLNDIRFGEFEGRLLTDYRAWAHAHGPEDVVPGGDESRAETVARYVLEAIAGRDPAARIEYVPYAEPFRLDALELRQAVERMSAWLERPTWHR